MRALLVALPWLLLVGCVGTTPGVMRRVDGTTVRGRVVTTDGYASALRLALRLRGLGGGEPAAIARHAVRSNPGDDRVLAWAIRLAPNDPAVLRAARTAAGRSCEVSTELALLADATPPTERYVVLAGACPDALARLLEAMVARGATDAATDVIDRTARPDDRARWHRALDAMVRQATHDPTGAPQPPAPPDEDALRSP